MRRVAGLDVPDALLVAHRYEAALSPHLAAMLEGAPPPELATIEEVAGRVFARYDYVVVEGAGGVICPFRHEPGAPPEARLYQLDVVRRLGLPALLVADAGLGTINHTLLSLDYLEGAGVAVAGLVLNRWRDDAMCRDNRRILEALTGLPILACVAEGDERLALEAGTLARVFASMRRV